MSNYPDGCTPRHIDDEMEDTPVKRKSYACADGYCGADDCPRCNGGTGRFPRYATDGDDNPDEE